MEYLVNTMEFGDAILLAHLVGTIFGICAAYYFDTVLSKLCNTGVVTRRIYLSFRHAVKACTFATALLWSTSLIYISYLANVRPESLTDPVFWAKITITAVISVNLLLISNVAMPMAAKRIGVSIFGGLTNIQQDIMIAIGAISGISWISIVVLGFVKLNLNGQDSMTVYGSIVLVYTASLAIGLLLSKIGGHVIRRRFLHRMEQKKSNHRRIAGYLP
ncbi:MAG: hypothetical protein WBM41_07570 [Arenicellales bacterium]